VARGDRPLAAGRVAWHGNYAPYKYDMARLQLHQHGQLHHPDPSIFTVLTRPRAARTAQRGLCHLPAALDGGRAHLPAAVVPRNMMNEFMGLILGQ